LLKFLYGVIKYMKVLRLTFAVGCLFSIFTVFTAFSAFASDACYTNVEAEAEQGIRIHSELMVIGLNCVHMSDAKGKNLYTEHKKFTAKHKDLIANYETIMMEYLQRNGQKDPERAMHSMRTKFANKISNDVATMRPDIFCKTYAKRIEKVGKMDDEALRKWAATPFPEHPVSHPMCK